MGGPPHAASMVVAVWITVGADRTPAATDGEPALSAARAGGAARAPQSIDWRLRSRASEKFNPHLRGIFDGHGSAPGAGPVYPRALRYRHEQRPPLRTLPKAAGQ
ncbi:MAG: hypothetical protein JO250_20455 [Armatimonadetes bacterium]|nr:hypothetical protein [Armatimonadota bacterium]